MTAPAFIVVLAKPGRKARFLSAAPEAGPWTEERAEALRFSAQADADRLAAQWSDYWQTKGYGYTAAHTEEA